MNSQTTNGKIKILKLEPLSTPQLKRRRSHSHNGADLSNSEFFTSNGNSPQFFIQSHKDSSPMESSQLKQIISNSNSPYMNNQLIKDKHKKETHNRVERKRRDFINCQIQKLAELLPSEFFLHCDLKMNKGVILKNSVEYITSMKLVEQINQQLIHENDLGAKLILSLISANDLNCSQLSINENLSRSESSEDPDIGTLFNQWYGLHQENKQLLQQFTHKFSTGPLSDSRDNYNQFKNVVVENITLDDTKIHSSSATAHIPCRKRYSSLPTNISPDSQFQRCQNSNVHFIPDKSSPILNSLLKKPNSNHNFTHNETIEPLYRIDSNDDGVDFYLRYSSSPLSSHNINTDNALIIERTTPESMKDCKFFYSKDKTYYVLPKSNFTNGIDEENTPETDDRSDKLLVSIDRSDQFMQSNDPMLLSSSPPHP